MKLFDDNVRAKWGFIISILLFVILFFTKLFSHVEIHMHMPEEWREIYEKEEYERELAKELKEYYASPAYKKDQEYKKDIEEWEKAYEKEHEDYYFPLDKRIKELNNG